MSGSPLTLDERYLIQAALVAKFPFAAIGRDLFRQDHRQRQAVAVLAFVASRVVRETVAIHRRRFWHHRR